jgi:hypothetical protein
MKFLLWFVVLASVSAFAQSGSVPDNTNADAPSSVSIADKKSSDSAQAAASTVPVLDGGIGPCSAEFQITTGNNKPVYNAQVHTLIKYGAFGVRKLDLAGSTNVDGKIKFTGLPDVNKRPVFFDITQGEKTAQRTFEPGVNCHPVFAVILP